MPHRNLTVGTVGVTTVFHLGLEISIIIMDST